MTLDELKQLITTGESTTLEFKKSTANLKGVAQTLCAFLNGEGGTALIGVNDSQKILGQKVTDQTQLDIAQVLRKFEPTANVDVSFVDFHDNDHKVIVMTTHVDKSSMPYVYDGRAYERCGSSTSQMSQTRYQQMLLDKIQKYHAWELMGAINFTFDDLDHNEILNTISDSIQRGRMESRLATDDPKEALFRLKTGVNINKFVLIKITSNPYLRQFQAMLRLVFILHQAVLKHMDALRQTKLPLSQDATLKLPKMEQQLKQKEHTIDRDNKAAMRAHRAPLDTLHQNVDIQIGDDVALAVLTLNANHPTVNLSAVSAATILTELIPLASAHGPQNVCRP